MIEAQILENHKIMISKNAISDSVKYETIKFSFPKAWGNYAKTAVFKNEEKAVLVILEDGNPLYLGENECYIPHEVLTFPGFSVSVFGNEGDSLATTARGFVTVLQSGYEQGDSPQEPTLDEYSQILAVMNETKDIAQSVRDDADNGAFKGDKGDVGPQGTQGPKGEQGPKGDKGEDATTDQTYNPQSENAQSGIAVDQALEPYKYLQKDGGGYTNLDSLWVNKIAHLYGDIVAEGFFIENEKVFIAKPLEVNANATFSSALVHGNADIMGELTVNNYPIKSMAEPTDDYHLVNKKYVDNQIGDRETTLDNIIAIQNELIGGGSV